MIKRVLAVAALSFALPAFATIYEVENNGSIPTAQTLGLTGAGTVSIEGAITHCVVHNSSSPRNL